MGDMSHFRLGLLDVAWLGFCGLFVLVMLGIV